MRRERRETIDKSDIVEEFFFLLEKFPDEPRHLYVFTIFLRTSLRNKVVDGVPPTTEIMTIIKHERPVIYSLMKKSTENLLNTLTYTPMDFEVARERLNTIINKS